MGFGLVKVTESAPACRSDRFLAGEGHAIDSAACRSDGILIGEGHAISSSVPFGWGSGW
ncbi:MAG: hypothetical protein U5K84_04550 [Alkalibacterium sp.]|nr:hypothetical protein [Alkalibacterium sp.]